GPGRAAAATPVRSACDRQRRRAGASWSWALGGARVRAPPPRPPTARLHRGPPPRVRQNARAAATRWRQRPGSRSQGRASLTEDLPPFTLVVADPDARPTRAEHVLIVTRAVLPSGHDLFGGAVARGDVFSVGARPASRRACRK